jgi:erythritol transport system substrate-binding protein
VKSCFQRMLAITVAAATMLTMNACRRSDYNRPLMSIIVPSQDNPIFKAEADAAAARARALGYRVRVDAHDDDAYRQDNLIDAAIASNAVAIILDNAGADASIAAVRRATKAGIPCFLIDREIQADGIAKAQIISDNDQGAKVVAAEFERALKLVSAQSANWSQSEAFQKTETILQAHGDIAGIIAGNDTMALGAAAAVKSGGRTNIRITGFDGIPDALAAISSGEMQATALQPTGAISQLAVDEADQFLKSGTTGKPERQVIRCELVTKDNVDHYFDLAKSR